MKLKEIRRTATFAWSPTAEPLLATGTVAGALDESFSNDSFLEIWEPDFMDKSEYELGGQQKTPRAVVTTTSRFNRIAWGFPGNGRARGIIAAGMENGELGLWDPEKVLSTSDPSESLILRNTTHQGSVRGLDFNPIQSNLLSSGATNGEIYIWDLKDPSKPYSPGTRSSKLDEITALAWNRQVQHVLASSSSTGYTVVWDLRNKREVVALQYGGQSQTIGGGGRAGMSDVAWHPDNATRLVTASDDDNTPVVMLWDLRNAHAPVKLLSGHDKGVLSLSWCGQDADLLLSCGKDNRALCWNPQTAEIIGELPYSNNWAFRVQWCPKNPDLIATADYDGTIGIHSLQSTNDSTDSQQLAPTPKADGSDVFDTPGFSRTAQSTLSLKQPPKWLRRPISSSFGYGGKLVSVSNLQSAQGANQSSVVHLRNLVTEPTIVDRARKLKAASEGDGLETFAKEKANVTSGHADETWKALSTLFTANSRDELVTLLGFSKAESATRVSEAVEKIKANVTPTIPPHVDIDYMDKPHEPIVSFAEPELTPTTPEADQELTPSEQSTSVASDTTGSTKPADGESTTTVPSLFDDDIGTPQLNAEADFFSSMGTIRNALPEHNQIPHQNYAHDSSVAATIGSRPSSAASETMKSNTFKIYPSDESDIDSLVTKSLILGDFESAVTLCLSAERYADAILLAVKGSPELLHRTQKAYFEKRTVNLPYLRLFQSIVTEDLDDIVQNADLHEWQEIFVVLCTFAKPDEFSNLAEQLGQRLEFQAGLMKNMESSGAEDLRKNATLAYLAAGRLEKVINIWIEEMSEDEAQLLGNFDEKSSSRYSAHAHALQTLMEKVAIFRGATKYVDGDLNATQDSSAMRTYKLSGLYERYFEYADLLAAQGLLEEAVSFLELIPAKYESDGNCDFDFSVARERLLEAAKAPVASTSRAPASSSYKPATTSNTYSQQSYPSYPSQLSVSSMPARAASPAKQTPSYPAYGTNGSAVPSQTVNTYTPLNMTSAPLQHQYQPAAPMQPYGNAPSSFAPPPPGRAQQAVAPPPPPPKKKEDGGWNDAPMVIRDRRPPSTNPAPSKAPITAPFPGAGSSPSSGPGSPAMYGQAQALPPPPRPGSVNRGNVPPPPPPGQVRPPPGAQHGPPGPGNYHLPPQRTFSPSQGGQHQGPPGPPPPRAPSQFAPPPPQNRALSPPQNLGPPQQPGGGRGLGPPPQRGPGMPPAGGHQYTQPPPGWGPSGRGPPGPFPAGSPVARPGSLGPQGQPSAPSPDMYAPPPGNGPRQPPPPGTSALGLQQNSQMGPPPSGPPPSNAPPGGSVNTTRSPPVKQGPPPPKYPPGDRSHIPESSRRTYDVLLNEINRLKRSSVPVPKRFVDDIDHRMNALFDAMNCETLSPMVTEKLGELSSAIESRNQGLALSVHSDLLQQSSASSRPEDSIGSWMAAVRQLIMRLHID